MKKLILWLMLLLVCANASAQNVYYVRTDGNDSNSGTVNSAGGAWQHWSKAISSFTNDPTNGAVINFVAGTYNENVNLNRGGLSSTVRLVLKCTTQWTVPSNGGCKIRGPSGDTPFQINTDNVDIGADNYFGFDISNPNQSYGITSPCNLQNPFPNTGNCSNGNSIHVLGNNLHDLSTAISTCEVNPNGHPAIAIQNRHGPYLTDLIIRGNRITNIGNQSLSALNGGPGCINYYAMYIDTQQAKVQNNFIRNIAGYGIHFYSSPCQGDISNNDIDATERTNIIAGGGDCNNGVPSGNFTISNNILGKTASGQANITIGVPGGGGAGSPGHTILVANNIFSGASGGQVLVVGTSYTTIQGSISEAPTTTYTNYTGGNNDDFQPRTGGRGTTAIAPGGLNPGAPLIDATGKLRNTTPTIGALEFGGTVAQPPAAPTGLATTVN